MAKTRRKVENDQTDALAKKPRSKRKGKTEDLEDSRPAAKKRKVDADEVGKTQGVKKENGKATKTIKSKPKSTETSKKSQPAVKTQTKKVEDEENEPKENGKATKTKKSKPKSTETSKKSQPAKKTLTKEVEDEGNEAKAPISKNKKVSTVAANSTNHEGKFVGAHVSISGGLWKAVDEAVEIGARSFAMFLKSQRQWVSKPLKMEDAEKFKKACEKHGFSPFRIVPHGSYLMNCGSPKEDVLQKSRDMLVEELKRCENMGLALFNFHPGSTCGEISKEESIKLIADSINVAINQTKSVIAVIENMSCQGNTLGGKFEELRAIIDQVKNKSRIGVCLDTCHAFAAGYNIATEKGYENMMSDFESIIGLKYLKALHLNDSKGEVGCHLDRHENIGKGKIGLEGFRRVMNDPRLNGLPMILETPYGDYAKEIRKLNSLVAKG